MTERLLQFIWQFQYFNGSELATTQGEPIGIIHLGTPNTNQGPDFSDAKIRIGDTIWAGAVELHLKTSGWNKHNHETDSNYKNVILHVVWEDDQRVNEIPVLELKSRIPKLLLRRYGTLMNTSSFIPCSNSIGVIKQISWKSWKDRLLAERLSRKSEVVGQYLHQCKFHWEETFWWLLARNFGIPVNAVAFESMARTLPLKIITRHMKQLHQVESLLLGQAGLLSGKFVEEYPQLLQREYRFLKGKYSLMAMHQPVHFLRMRPANFPTLRLAQLAMLIHRSDHLLERIRQTESIRDVRQLFDIQANDYWHYHYRFDETSAFMEKRLGESMIGNILINTIVPVLFAYGEYHNEERYKEKAIRWLEETAPESNNILRAFYELGVENKNAFDSQALIELKTMYCDHKRCLECAIGCSILKI